MVFGLVSRLDKSKRLMNSNHLINNRIHLAAIQVVFKLQRAGQVLKLSDAVVQIALKRSRGCSSSRSSKDSADPSSNLVVRLLQFNVCRIHKVLGNELVGHGSKQIEMSELVKKSRAKKLNKEHTNSSHQMAGLKCVHLVLYFHHAINLSVKERMCVPIYFFLTSCKKKTARHPIAMQKRLFLLTVRDTRQVNHISHIWALKLTSG